MTRAARIFNEYDYRLLLLSKGSNPQFESFYKENLVDMCRIAKQELDGKQQKIDKAIERIESLIIFWKKYTDDNQLEVNQLMALEDILKGDDKNE